MAENGNVERRQPEPGCETCIHKDGCERAKALAFCPMWQSKEPEPKGEDPNEAWRRGEEADF